MPAGQQYATNVPQTTLTGQINPTATSMSVASSSGWPTTPFTAILDIGTSTQEPVDVTAVVGTTWTVTRAIDSTVGFTHQVGATVTHGDIGRDFREARSHIDASTGVHGIGGASSVVGTTDSQSLSNKTLVAAVHSGATAMGSGAWTGTGSLQEQTLGFTGISGAQALNIRLAGSHGTGPPTTGTFQLGDIVVDSQLPVQWFCTAAGSPGTWVPLSGKVLLGSTVVGGGGAASVTFSAIPQNFHNLQLVVSAKSDGATVAGYDSASIRLNGITGANYNWNSYYAPQGAGVTSVSANATTKMQCAEIWNAHFATAGRGIATIDLPDYSNTINGKSFTSTSTASDGGTAGILQTYSGTLSPTTSTAAITSLQILMDTGNFIVGSVFYLYGIW
jgi:hypothetical protein